MSVAEQLVVWISKNTVLVDGKLFVDGVRAGVRHIEDLRNIVLLTQSRVCEALEMLMPTPVPALNHDDATTNSRVEAWRDYAGKAIALRSGTEAEILQRGVVLLQWLHLVRLLAKLTPDAMVDTSTLAIISYMAENGPAALPVSSINWYQYVTWKVLHDRHQFSLSDASVADPGVNPLAQSIRITVPFIGDYLGAGRVYIDVVGDCFAETSGDLLAGGQEPLLMLGGAAMQLRDDLGLIAEFEAMQGAQGKSPATTLMFARSIGLRNFMVRAQRTLIPSNDPRYIFRFFDASPRETADITDLRG